MDLGAFTVMLWTFIEREKLYDIFENVTGAGSRPPTRASAVSSAMSRRTSRRMVRKFMDEVLDDRSTRSRRVLNGNRIFRDRIAGVSPDPDGCRHQLRSHRPDAPRLRRGVRRPQGTVLLTATRTTSSSSITDRRGDAWCRYRVRVREMRESIKIIDQVLKTMPQGRSTSTTRAS
jgi:NADH-quinone oxidoreductase subunit D